MFIQFIKTFILRCSYHCMHKILPQCQRSPPTHFTPKTITFRQLHDNWLLTSPHSRSLCVHRTASQDQVQTQIHPLRCPRRPVNVLLCFNPRVGATRVVHNLFINANALNRAVELHENEPSPTPFRVAALHFLNIVETTLRDVQLIQLFSGYSACARTRSQVVGLFMELSLTCTALHPHQQGI